MRLPIDFLRVLRGVPLPTTLTRPMLSTVIHGIWSLPTFEAQRIALAPISSLLPRAAGVQIDETTVGGLRTLRIVPPNSGEGAVLYLHGGGFCVLSPEAYSSMLTWLATAAGVTVYAPEYRLGPENPFPAAYDDAVAAALGMLDRVPADQLVIAGDSAGGTLSLGAATAVVRQRGVQLGGLVLLSAMVDPTIPDATTEDTMLSQQWTTKVHTEYYPDDLTDIRIAPLRGNLHGLPPTLVQVAENEMLGDHSVAIAAALEAAGVDVTFEQIPGFWHSGHVFAGLLKESANQTARVGAFIRQCLASESRRSSTQSG